MPRAEAPLAVITGAAAGLGKALAQALAERGYRLVLADIDGNALQAVATKIPGALHEPLDVANREAVFAFAARVLEQGGTPELVFNNAGVNLTVDVAQQSSDDLAWIMGVNFHGVVHGTQAFLPALRAAGRGRIVNVSSVFGLLGWPTQAAYCASKAAVRGFTEALQHELEGSGVGAVLVLPGSIRTGIVGRGRYYPPEQQRLADLGFRRLARTTPGEAAQQILRGLDRNRSRILVGRDARVFDSLQRLAPQRAYGVIKAMLDRLS